MSESEHQASERGLAEFIAARALKAAGTGLQLLHAPITTKPLIPTFALGLAGVYFDALQVSFGDIVSPLWVRQILVAVNPFGV